MHVCGIKKMRECAVEYKVHSLVEYDYSLLVAPIIIHL